MDKEDFVTYEQADTLKGLGFNLKCNYAYSNENKELIENIEDDYNISPYHDFNNETYGVSTNHISAPTLSQVQKWLYKTFGLCIITSINNVDKYWIFIIKQVVFLPNNKPYSIGRIKKESNFITPEEALSKGITECLKLLKKDE